ncbi:MAG: ABC transporter ATP-binding protein, partial [Schaalia sp.]|nr:ABC transporter ATP-binding protein [Schaalia sp.]
GKESAGQGSARGGVSDAAARRAAKKEVARIERKLERLRAEASSLEAKLEKLSIQVATDPSAVSELTKVSAAHQDVLAEMDELEEAWLEAADLLE